MSPIVIALFCVFSTVTSYEGLQIKDLPKETANELLKIFKYQKLKVNCTDNTEPSKPIYLLFNRDHTNDPVELNPSNINEIKNEKNTIVFIPGWLMNLTDSVIPKLKDAYLKRYDCNFIIVDWLKDAFLPYTSIFCDVRSHALNVADFLCALEWEEPNILLEDIHVLGHSFGAHIAGFAGEYTEIECDRKIGRITGLDPAGPFYNYEANDKKLSKEHALYVDIIHTDFMLGAGRASGHIDFHSHCPRAQPGCRECFGTIPEDTYLSECLCSSVRSIELMAESVNSNQLIAVSCGRCSIDCNPDHGSETYTVMGEDSVPPTTWMNNFLIYTNDRPPYGLGLLPYPEA